MNKKISLGVMLTVVVLAIAVTASVTTMVVLRFFDSMVYDGSSQENVYEKLTEIEKTVEKHYLHEVDEGALQDAVAAGYIAGLGDEYSTYYTAEEYEQKKMTNAGMRIGIGITLQMEESGYARILSVASGTPAKEAGLKKDDLIVAVDGNSVLQSTLNDVVSMISGKEGTEVVITVRRDTGNQEYTLTRTSFDLQTVEYEMLEKLGYIKITGFNSKTPTQFANALEDVKQQGATGLIFDLRGNGGGMVDAVSKCLDLLVGEGDLVTAEYADGHTKVMYQSDASETDLPMVVLQNGSTASAAELFSATLRDFGKASIVGVQSYGKGVMQTLYELEDGSAINITTARIYPNSMVSFHEVGIAPTYEVTTTKEQEQLIAQGSHADDPQLNKAIEILDVAK